MNDLSKAGLAYYYVAATLANEHLKTGLSVIIDAVSGKKEFKDVWRNLANQHNAKLTIIECACEDEKLHKERVENRSRRLFGVPELQWQELDRWRKEYIPWAEKTLLLDAGDSKNENAEKALNYIQQLPI